MRGNSYLLVLIDSFTKFTIAKPTRTLRSGEAVQKLREIFGEFGYPRRVISDRGLAFASKAFGEFLAKHGVKHTLNAVMTPRANGQVERRNRTIVDTQTTSADNEARWDEQVPEIIWGINQPVSTSTSFPPAYLMFPHSQGVMVDLGTTGENRSEAIGDEATISGPGGDEATSNRLSADEANTRQARGDRLATVDRRLLNRRRMAAENLTKAGEAMKVHYDKRRKVASTYEAGELVLWRQAGTSLGDKGVNRKLSNKFEGPYKITKALVNDRYEIAAVKGLRGYKKFKAVVPVDALRRYCSTTPGADVDVDGETSTDTETEVGEHIND